MNLDKIGQLFTPPTAMNFSALPQPVRDLMAPDTEPTDEELATVMREALAVALERKAQSDEWMRQQLRDAVAQARNRTLEVPAR